MDFAAEVKCWESRPDIPGGTNACGHLDQQSEDKWPGSTNRCQPSILSVHLLLSELKSWGGWLQAASGAGDVSAAGCNSNEQTVSAGLGEHELGVELWAFFALLLRWLSESYWRPRKFKYAATLLSHLKIVRVHRWRREGTRGWRETSWIFRRWRRGRVVCWDEHTHTHKRNKNGSLNTSPFFLHSNCHSSHRTNTAPLN